MVLMKFAERVGLLDIVAPRQKARARRKEGDTKTSKGKECASKSALNEGGPAEVQDCRYGDSIANTRDGSAAATTEERGGGGGTDGDIPKNAEETDTKSVDIPLTAGASPDEIRKRRRLRAQLNAELDAEKRGGFAKKQRVEYHHKATDERFDAVVVGVHFDDGPDRPYYTIRYSRIEVALGSDGNTHAVKDVIEKQTTPDRLKSLPWDEDATWKVIA